MFTIPQMTFNVTQGHWCIAQFDRAQYDNL